MDNIKAFTREEALHLPFYNYRKVDSSKEELASLAQSMASQGQLVPILVGLANDSLIGELPDLAALLINGNRYFVIGGERRTRAFLMMEDIPDIPVLQELQAIVKENLTATELLLIQMTENFDRKDSGFCEMGEAFFRSRERNVPLIELVKTVNWGAEYAKQKDRLNFIQERMDYRLLDPSLWEFLDNGLLYGGPGKKHQLYEVAKTPAYVQQKLAEKFKEYPVRMTERELTGKLTAHAAIGFLATWDLADEKLGIKKYGTGACEGCRFRHAHTYSGHESNWKKVESWMCLHDQCFDAKKLKNEMAVIRDVEKEGNFVYIGDDGTRYGYGEERVKNGKPHLESEKYKLAEEGSCPHCTKAISLNLAQSAGKPITFVCLSNTKCPVHWPQAVAKSNEKREERKKQEVAKVSGTVAKAVRTSLHDQLMAMLTNEETAMDLFPAKLPDVFSAMLINAIRFIGNAMPWEARDEWKKLVGWGDKHISLWDEQSYRKVVPPGGELRAFILINAMYMPSNAQNFESYWDAMAKMAGGEFEKMVKKASEAEIKEVKEKQAKKDVELMQAHVAEMDCLRFLLVEVNWMQNVDLESEDWWESMFSTEDEMTKRIVRMMKVPGYKATPEKLRGKKAMGRYNELKAKFPKFKLDKEEERYVNKLKSAQAPQNVVITGAAGELLSKAFNEEVKDSSYRLVKAEISCANYKDDTFSLPYGCDLTIKRLNKTAKSMLVELQQVNRREFKVLQDKKQDAAKPVSDAKPTKATKKAKAEPVPA